MPYRVRPDHFRATPQSQPARLAPGLQRTIPLIVGLLIQSLFAPTGSGQTHPPAHLALADSIDAAVARLDGDRIPDFATSSQEVLQNIDAAKLFFSRSTDAANFDGWMTFLGLQPIVDAIQSGGSPTSVAREAIELRFRLIGVDPGLELNVLRRLRQSLDPLIGSVRFGNQERSIRGIGNAMESTAAALRDDPQPVSPNSIDELNTLLDLLTSANQLPELVTQISDQFSSANVGVLIGEPLIESAANRAVLQNRSINDCILGTRVIGDATLTGTLTGDLKPSVGSALLQLNLNGRIVSRNTGFNGPVQLRTVGSGVVHATRYATIDLNGLRLGPSSVAATLDTDVVSITPNLRLGRRIVRKIASRRIAEQKPKADRIAVEKLRQQVTDQFNSQTQSAAKFEPPGIFQSAAAMLQRLSLPQPDRIMGSTETELTFDITFRRDDQLAAVTPRPMVRMKNSPSAATVPQGEWMGVQIHESVINNAATPVLGGRTLSQDQIQDLIARSDLPLPPGFSQLKPTTETDSGSDVADEDSEELTENFEIDFARVRPIVFEARDGSVRLGVRGTRFSQGSRELKRDLEIYAEYVPAIAADGTMLLIRRGDAKVDFPGSGRRLSVADAGLRRTMEKRFSRVFPEDLLTRPIPVPTTAKLPALAGRNLRVRSIDIDRGWFTVVIQ